MSSHMTGAQATIAQVAAEGVRVVFGIPGVHTLPLCDAVLEHPELRFLHGRLDLVRILCEVPELYTKRYT